MKHKVKSAVLTLALALALAPPVVRAESMLEHAQAMAEAEADQAAPVAAPAASAAPADTTATNVPSGPGWLTTLWDDITSISSPTNFADCAYVVYAPNAPKGSSKFGFGDEFFWNVNANVGAGIGIEYLGQFYNVSCQLKLQVPTKPISWIGGFATNITVTPFVVTGVGTPLGGTAGQAVVGIADAGANVDIAQLLGGELSVFGAASYWANAGPYTGNHYLGGLAWRKGF